MGSINVKTTNYTEPLKTLQAHSAGINCFALSPDQTILASGSDDCTIRLWTQCDAQQDYVRCYQILAAHTNYVTVLMFFRDRLLSGSADRDIRQWDVRSGQCLLVLSGHDDVINSIVCTRDHVFSASNDKTAICWDFNTGMQVTQFKGHTHNVNAVTCTEQNEEAVNERNGEAHSAGDMAALIKQMGSRECVYTGSADKTAKAWSTRSGKCLLTFRGHSGPITQMRIDKHGHILYTISADGTARSWYAESAKPQFVFEGHKSDVICLETTSQYVISTGNDGLLVVWPKWVDQPVNEEEQAAGQTQPNEL
ncbi:unnamed protein product [Echinostoma caproni]|uniref:WD_REPEATS_REGION domain-containing protein n=1 Tax=Echinostoma caproni TaxID=27848 RepID=A0A183AEG6_9TREM|nr:unnamed protein product [Echinostoma caproni]